ncbi:MAG: hypothetical protein ACLU0T_02885 [Bacteroidales bacterium]
MTATIAIVDYCKGNLASVQRGAPTRASTRITDVPGYPGCRWRGIARCGRFYRCDDDDGGDGTG